jgi:hypothetical protein
MRGGSRFPKPTPALVLAAIALFVALGAPGYAARTLDKALFAKKAGSAKKAGFAKRAGKVDGFSASGHPKAHRLLALDGNGKFPASVGLAGPVGPQGPQGTRGLRGVQGAGGLQGPRGFTGTPGSAIGFSRIFYGPDDHGANPDWRADDVFSKGIDNDAHFHHPSAGVYCFHDLPFNVSNAVATLGGVLSGKYQLSVAFGATDAVMPQGCTPAANKARNAVVRLYDISGANPTPTDPVQNVNEIYVLFN